MNARASIGMAFSKLRIPANAWTALILIPGVLSLYFLVSKDFLLAGICFLGALVIDVIDGSVAYVTTKVTNKGAFLDSVVTAYLEAFMLFGLVLAGLPDLILPASAWVLLALFGFMGMEYSSALAKQKGLIEKDWIHLVIKPTRMSLLLVIVFSAQFDAVFAVSLLATASIISLLAMLNRQLKALSR